MVKRQLISDEVWEQNYRGPDDNSLKDTWTRQAKACAAVERKEVRDQTYEDFLWLLTDFKGIAGGRITANLGIKGREATTLFNCFVHNPQDINYSDPDSINGIYDMLKAQAQTLKSEGGYGMNFSWIRPSGSYVEGIGGRTPGVLKFMELWDKSSEIITMGCEDIVGERKKTEKKKIRKGAQMGVLDCVSGDTLISTIQGKIKIKDLVDKTPLVYCTDNDSIFIRKANKVWSKGVKKIVKITFDNDETLVCTPDHRIMMRNGDYKQASNLQFGDSVCAFHKRLYNKYLQLSATGTKTIPEHIAVAEYKYNRYPIAIMADKQTFDESSEVVHHADLNPGEEYTEHYKGGFSNQFGDKANHKVISVEEGGEEEVFDISVPEFHNCVANDIFIHNCWHPDIENFIEAKLVSGVLTKFNLSVGITEGFMAAVVADADWDLEFPITDAPEFKKHWKGDLADWKNRGLPTTVYKTVKARAIWEKIMQSTYTKNDPGVLFLDTINKRNPLCYAENIRTTNPCGEIAMSTGVCLLFSLNLVKYIEKDSEGYGFDIETFKRAVMIATRFADNINDISSTPLKEYSKSMQEKRRLGIGVLGLGSLHYILGIRFGSIKSLELIEEIFKAKAETEILTSAQLGAEKGSFLLFDKEKYFSSHWWKTLPIAPEVKEAVEKIGEMRNSHRAANAPTGNMSVYAGVVSGGIEPVIWKEYIRWAVVPEYERHRLKEEGFKFPNVFKGEWLATEHMKWAKAGAEDILLGSFGGNDYQVDRNRGLTKKTWVEDWGWSFVKEHLSKDKIDEYESNGVFATTDDLTIQEHLNTLKTISPFVDQNSSKTINLSNDFNYEDFKGVYLEAWTSGIKGVTTYRHGTMTAVLEDANKEKEKEEKETERKTPARPCALKSETIKIKLDTGDEVKNAYVTTSFFPDTRNPYEVFINTPVGNNLKDLQILELSARMTSLALRHGISVEFINDQLTKIDGQYVYSIPNSLAKALRLYGKNAEVEEAAEEAEQEEGQADDEPRKGSKCPQCGAYAYIQKESCGGCLSCGYEKCG